MRQSSRTTLGLGLSSTARTAVLLSTCCLSAPLMAQTGAAPPVALPSTPSTAASAPSSGSDAQSGQVGLEDIVVTAQRRSENLQNVPVTVSAISGAAIAAQGIATVADLNIVSPGLNVTRLTAAPSIYLRGVGNNNATAGQEQNVAVYVDGVYFPSVSADLGSFQNVERIEVLKGPQGTLFGRNATGGLIQIITKDPTQEVSGSATFGYGNYRTVDSSAYVTGGITSTLAADIAVNYHKQIDGWGRNLTTGEKIYRSDSSGIRSKWVWKPLVGTKVTAIGSYNTSFSDIGDANQLISLMPIAGLGGDRFPGSIYDTTSNVRNIGSNTTQYSGSLKIEQDVGFADLTSLSAYQNTKRRTILDLDKSAFPRLQASFPDTTKSFSQEIQLSSNKGGPFKWIAGAFYIDLNAAENPLAIRAGPTQVLAASYDTGQKTKSISGYGQATYAIAENTNITAGGRYTSDRKELYGSLTALTPAGYVTLRPNDSTRKKTFKRFDYKVGIDHHFTPDVMAYASVSTGFKSGVYNITFSTPTDAPVNPEKLTSYEAGVKTELFDQRVRINLTGFYYDYQDIQLLTFVGTSALVLNAASARIYGGEGELQARFGRLSLNGGAAVVHSEYRDFPNAPSYNTANGLGVAAPVNASGNELLRTPKFTGNASATYTLPVSFGEFRLTGSFYHSAPFFFEPDNRLRQAAYNLVNTELAWTSSDGVLTVRAWAKNLTNTKYYSILISGLGAPDSASPAAPRTYGGSVGFKF